VAPPGRRAPSSVHAAPGGHPVFMPAQEPRLHGQHGVHAGARGAGGGERLPGWTGGAGMGSAPGWPVSRPSDQAGWVNGCTQRRRRRGSSEVAQQSTHSPVETTTSAAYIRLQRTSSSFLGPAAGESSVPQLEGRRHQSSPGLAAQRRLSKFHFLSPRKSRCSTNLPCSSTKTT